MGTILASRTAAPQPIGSTDTCCDLGSGRKDGVIPDRPERGGPTSDAIEFIETVKCR
jgi:hypothetical protein